MLQEEETKSPHGIVEHQGLDDGAKASHQILDLRGAGHRVGNITDYQQAAPAYWNRTLLQDAKEQSVTY